MSIEKSIHKMGNNSSVVHKDTPCQQDLLPSSSENAARIDDSSSALPSSRWSSRKRKTLSSCSTLPPKKDEASKKKRKRQKDVETEFDMLWICSECKEAECMMKADAEQLLICEGTCRRLFHYPCAGLSQLPDQDKKYICKDCIEQGHPCCIAMITVWTTRLSFVVARTRVASFFTSPVFRCRMLKFVLYRRTAARPTTERVAQHLRLQTTRSLTWTIISSHKQGKSGSLYAQHMPVGRALN